MTSCKFHPDFWMPAIKELNFFFPQFLRRSAAMAARRFERNPEKALTATNAKRVVSKKRPLDQRDLVFFEEVCRALEKGKERGVDDYARLFLPKGMKARFERERRRCAKRFGGPATLWPDAPY